MTVPAGDREIVKQELVPTKKQRTKYRNGARDDEGCEAYAHRLSRRESAFCIQLQIT